LHLRKHVLKIRESGQIVNKTGFTRSGTKGIRAVPDEILNFRAVTAVTTDLFADDRNGESNYKESCQKKGRTDTGHGTALGYTKKHRPKILLTDIFVMLTQSK
jgi:hypothetical protein